MTAEVDAPWNPNKQTNKQYIPQRPVTETARYPDAGTIQRTVRPFIGYFGVGFWETLQKGQTPITSPSGSFPSCRA